MPTFIPYPVENDVYQGKYGVNPWHQKDTRNLLNTVAVSSKVIDRNRILRAFFNYSSLNPVRRINAEVKDNMNTKRRDWVINKDDLLQFINEQKPDEAHKYEKILADLDDKILVEDIKGFIGKNAIKYTKQEKDDELLLKIQLLR